MQYTTKCIGLDNYPPERFRALRATRLGKLAQVRSCRKLGAMQSGKFRCRMIRCAKNWGRSQPGLLRSRSDPSSYQPCKKVSGDSTREKKESHRQARYESMDSRTALEKERQAHPGQQ